MSDSSPIPWDRIAGLLQRARSAQKEEARTSAYLLTKLIHKYGLRIVAPEAEPRSTFYEAPRQGDEGARDVGWTDNFSPWEDLENWARTADEIAGEYRARAAGRRGPRSRRRKASPDDVIYMDAVVRDVCVACGERIFVGERIAHYPLDGQRSYHMTCAEKRAKERR